MATRRWRFPIDTHTNEEWSRRLKELVALEPTEERRDEVRQAIATKREGLCVLSARVLAQWADHESKDRLKSLLDYHSRRPAGWSATGAMSKSIMPLLDASDVDWALELYLVQSKPSVRFTMISLFDAFDPAAVRRKLERRLAEPKGANPRDIRAVLLRLRE